MYLDYYTCLYSNVCIFHALELIVSIRAFDRRWYAPDWDLWAGPPVKLILIVAAPCLLTSPAPFRLLQHLAD